MPFIPISISEIRPFVRFVITTKGLNHTMKLFAFEHRLIFMKKGEAKIAVGGKEYSLTENDAILIRAGIDYRMTSSEDAASTYIYFDMTMANSDKKLRIKPVSVIKEDQLFCNRCLIFDDQPLTVLKIPGSANIRNRVESISNLFSPANTQYDENILSGMMVTVISRLLSNASKGLGGGYSADVVAKVIKYITENYNEAITLKSIASAVNFHQSYISRCFQKELNMPIHKYLLTFRLEQAMQLLMYSDSNIATIAEKTGFSNDKHFSTTFKKYYGISPSGLRK